jgi:hypothetical protein
MPTCFGWPVLPENPLSYASVSTTPRPPRVVIVIDGGPHWSYWARRALHRACRIWGGAGFAVVPHHDGEVHPTLPRACRAYDPDYVVNYHPTVGDVEHFAPGVIRVVGAGGEPLVGAERERLLKPVLEDPVSNEAGEAARAQIASVCSTYQSSEYAGWHEALNVLHDRDDPAHFTPVLEVPGTWPGPVLACPDDWGGVLGAAIASHAGVVTAPRRGTRSLRSPRRFVSRWPSGSSASAQPSCPLNWSGTLQPRPKSTRVRPQLLTNARLRTWIRSAQGTCFAGPGCWWLVTRRTTSRWRACGS